MPRERRRLSLTDDLDARCSHIRRFYDATLLHPLGEQNLRMFCGIGNAAAKVRPSLVNRTLLRLINNYRRIGASQQYDTINGPSS